MNKKRVLCLILTFLFLIPFIYAQTNSTNSTITGTGFEKGYSCLANLIDTKGVGSLTTEELSFSLAALTYDSNKQSSLKNALMALGSNGECWPSGSCTLKETSMALIALKRANTDTSKIKAWLKNQTSTASELQWFLQIDSASKTDCDISYSNNTKKITINSDKTISGSAGSCFKSAFNGYWLEISNTCLDTEFKISCDQDFISTLSYKEKVASQDAPYYLSSLTNTAVSGGTTTEKVTSLCFKANNKCDYEGSLWATLALSSLGEDVNPYLPYLISLSSNNQRYMPSAFLYMVTEFNYYFSDLVNQQDPAGYWKISPGQDNRFYDTSIALLALQGLSSTQAQEAEDYLLEVQASDGCWRNSVRDTAFILYSASPKNPSISSGGSGGLRSNCEDYGFSCLSKIKCNSLEGEDKGENYYCPFTSDICCSESEVEETCSDKGGITCSASKECTGTLEPSSDTSSCCVGGQCVEPEQSTCELNGYSCKSFCDSNTETEIRSYTCSGNDFCCDAKPTASSGGSYWWIWLLVILIILLVLAVFFRNQLKIWVFRVKNKFSKGPVPAQNRPPFPRTPPMPPNQMPRRFIGPPQFRPPMLQRRPPQPQRPFPKDNELQETLKKLREMGRK